MPIVLYWMSAAIEQHTVMDKQNLIFTQILNYDTRYNNWTEIRARDFEE